MSFFDFSSSTKSEFNNAFQCCLLCQRRCVESPSEYEHMAYRCFQCSMGYEWKPNHYDWRINNTGNSVLRYASSKVRVIVGSHGIWIVNSARETSKQLSQDIKFDLSKIKELIQKYQVLE